MGIRWGRFSAAGAFCLLLTAQGEPSPEPKPLPSKALRLPEPQRIWALAQEGRVEEARESLATALALHPGAPDLVRLQVELHLRWNRLEEAGKVLSHLKALTPAPLLEARLAVETMDYPKAKALYQARLAEKAEGGEALEGMGEIAYWEDRLDEAKSFLDRVLATAPNRSRAWRFLALVHRARQENQAWAACARKAVEADPRDDQARVLLADVLMRGEGKLPEGHQALRDALGMNPLNREAHAALGNGWTTVPARPALSRLEGDAAKALTAALTRGDEALTVLDLPKGRQAFEEALALEPAHRDAHFGLGAVHYLARDLSRAEQAFLAALQVDPDHGLAHYGLAMTLLRRRDAANVLLAEAARRSEALDAPEPPALRDVFPEYGALDRELQRIVRVSVAPLAGWLPLLKARKLTFHIFPFHHHLFQAPHQSGLRGEKTFDGRIWDEIKGVGGAHAAAGAEWQRDVKHLRFNVLTHEFAHQVHGQMPQVLREEITRLYTKAKADRKTLDFYSDANEMEYFAVGVEAFVSEAKLPDQKITYGHTRRELQARDPELHAFIAGLAKGPEGE